MNVDPAASMKIWAVEFKLGEEWFEIPPLPASDWLLPLMKGGVESVLDLVEHSHLDRLDRSIIYSAVDPSELSNALKSAVEQASGRTVHQTTVLIQTAVSHWSVVGGYLAVRGLAWDRISLGTALDAIYTAIMTHMRTTPNEEESRMGLSSPAQRFRDLLDNEPEQEPPSRRGGRRRARFDRKRAMAQFEEMAGPRPTAPREIQR